jgi:hypothetical protein
MKNLRKIFNSILLTTAITSWISGVQLLIHVQFSTIEHLIIIGVMSITIVQNIVYNKAIKVMLLFIIGAIMKLFHDIGLALYAIFKYIYKDVMFVLLVIGLIIISTLICYDIFVYFFGTKLEDIDTHFNDNHNE